MSMLFGLVGIAALAVTANAPDYGAWAASNSNGAWTRAAETAVGRSTLHELVPSDIGRYCAGYEVADKNDRVRFWAALLSAMARPESGFDPGVRYVEPGITDAKGRHVVSRGLLQISIESANQPRYGCGIRRAKDLHDPRKNLACAAKILSHWVARDGAIGAQDGENVGGARYWSALRKMGAVAEIQAFTQRLSFCAAP